MQARMSIEVKNLTHTYSAGSALQQTAVREVNLVIEEGEFVAIVGHTGSGKSTLVQHLNGLLKPTSGLVLVDGEDMNGEKVNKKLIRQKVGLVFQYPEYQLFEETVYKDIAFGPKNMGLSAEEYAETYRAYLDERYKDDKIAAIVDLGYDRAVAMKLYYVYYGNQKKVPTVAWYEDKHGL